MRIYINWNQEHFFEIDRSIKDISQINFNKFWTLDQVVKEGKNEHHSY